MPSQTQETGACPALLLGWTPPGLLQSESWFVSVQRGVSAVTFAERCRVFWEHGSLMQWCGSWIVPTKLMTVCPGRITVNILWFVYCVLHLTAFRSLGHCLQPALHRGKYRKLSYTCYSSIYASSSDMCIFLQPFEKSSFSASFIE